MSRVGKPASTVPEGSAVAESSANRSLRLLRWVAITTLPPLATFILQSLSWSTLSPFAWFLFYPPVLISAWFGGFRSGLVATVLSTVLVWSSFLPGSFRLDWPKCVLSSLIFLAMGLALRARSRTSWS
jgi:Domain of unknown function (DUF4118)